MPFVVSCCQIFANKIRKHNTIWIIYAVEQNCLPLLNHSFVLLTSIPGTKEFPWFQPPSRWCPSPDPWAEQKKAGCTWWFKSQALQIPCALHFGLSSTGSHTLPAHPEYLCLSLLLQPFLSPSTPCFYSPLSTFFITLISCLLNSSSCPYLLHLPLPMVEQTQNKHSGFREQRCNGVNCQTYPRIWWFCKGKRTLPPLMFHRVSNNDQDLRVVFTHHQF